MAERTAAERSRRREEEWRVRVRSLIERARSERSLEELRRVLRQAVREMDAAECGGYEEH